MSEALYDLGGLRFWTEREILVRDQAVATIQLALSSALTKLNSAWSFHRMEGPLLTPRRFISPAYDEDDIFLLKANLGEDEAALRAETTASSYLYAQHLLNTGAVRPPFCVWQVGKSFRRETMDGARASTLRYNEFYQLEFQCIYAANTKADYRAVAEEAVSQAIKQITRSSDVRMVDSDRLPAYSTQTRDVEVPFGTETMSSDHGWGHDVSILKWKEMASISTRTDFPQPANVQPGKELIVLEVAVGLDRLVAVEGTNP